ncbi:MAG TPA: hypothetical protein VK606_03330 [Verrucomicrobiae bacterium]|jgi:hypothetical protein|nr:hypothetical protein [Verrucomicrobiae bacterium]
MRKRAVVVGALAASLLAAGGPGTASANLMWCVTDPPIQVVTPGGHYLMVNNMIYLSPVDRHKAKLISDDAGTAPNGNGGTRITVHVYIPAVVHGAYVVSSNNRYQVTDAAGANGGRIVTLTLDVPTS